MELRVGIVKEPVICHICDFQPEYGGTFVDALICLHRYCRRNLKIGLFCIFPDNARNKSWLKRLDEERVQYGFVPRKKNVVNHVRLLLKNHDPLILHTHFFFFDLLAVLMKLLYFQNSTIFWHYHNPTERTVKQRIKDAFKIRVCFNHFGSRCIAVGAAVYESIRDAGMAGEKAVLIQNAVNIGRFLNKCEVTPEARRGLRMSTEDIVFLLLGWDPVRKGKAE